MIDFKVDKTHKWGIYKELLLNENWMSRIIQFYVGGMTSVHKHDVEEILMVESGLIKCLSGKNPYELNEKIYEPGEQIYLPANEWHACGAIKGISDKIPFALGVEYIWGDIKQGTYLIERFNESVPSPFKKNE